jgi:uncharacterized protein with NRDE domain
MKFTTAFWDDEPEIYAGRDLVGGGTWLGVTRGGRFAAVTNYRDPAAPTGTRSRGSLVADFLKGSDVPEQYLSEVVAVAHEYSGFNLLVGEIGRKSSLHYFSNRGGEPRELTPGIYGLSNHLLDTPWPKVVNGKAAFTAAIESDSFASDDLFSVLADETLAPDDRLPSTGVPFEAEKAISAIFIKTPGYGTRCSTILTFDRHLNWEFDERVFV